MWVPNMCAKHVRQWAYVDEYWSSFHNIDFLVWLNTNLFALILLDFAGDRLGYQFSTRQPYSKPHFFLWSKHESNCCPWRWGSGKYQIFVVAYLNNYIRYLQTCIFLVSLQNLQLSVFPGNRNSREKRSTRSSVYLQEKGNLRWCSSNQINSPSLSLSPIVVAIGFNNYASGR